MSEIREFIDAYSVDLIYLLEARRALLTHPLRGEYAFEDLLNASFCRLFIVTVVQAIEFMLNAWQERDHIGILNKYFSNQASNGDRVNALYSAFQQAGINVDREVFEDYLAIKYLRNTIVHGRWKNHEKEWLDLRGFPTDVRKFTKEHLDRVHHVYQNMMFYIFLTTVPSRQAPKPNCLVRLKEEMTRIRDEHGILRLSDINRIFWQNLERIDWLIYQDIEKVVVSNEYNWTRELSKEQIETLVRTGKHKRLLFLAAWRAGRNNHPLLARHRPLANDALVFWRKYWEWAVLPQGLDESRINQALRVLVSPDFPVELPVWSASGFLEKQDFDELLKKAIPTAPWNTQELVQALYTGKLAYQIFPNATPLTLFAVRLPIVDPENVSVYCEEAKRARDALKLRDAWYYCVERHKRFTNEDYDYDQYIQICQEFK
jgi:hypothetical protein